MKHRAFASIGLLCLLCLNAQGQPDSLWSHSYGRNLDDVCWSIEPANDGGYLLAGRTASVGPAGDNMWLVKTSADGDSLWSRAYGGSAGDQCRKAIQLADGGIALAGRTSSFGPGSTNFWLVKANGSGDSLWSRTFGGNSGEECNALLTQSDGGFVLAGTSQSFGAGGEDMWVIRVNVNGDSLWSHSFGGTAQDQCWAAAQAVDGGFLLSGSTMSSGSGLRDAWLVRTDGQGGYQWDRTYGGADHDVCYSMARTHDSGYVLAGYSDSYGNGSHDFYLIKVAANGDSLWSRVYGGSGDEICRSVTVLGDGGYLLSGYTDSFGPSGNNMWILRTNANGDSLWSRTFGRSSADIGYDALARGDNTFLLAGYSNSIGHGMNDFWLIKTGPDPSVEIEPQAPTQPLSYRLTAYPNPFNSSTTIAFDLTERQRIVLSVFDIRGRLVEQLADEWLMPGNHRIHYNAGAIPSGTYFVRLIGAEFEETKKIILLK